MEKIKLFLKYFFLIIFKIFPIKKNTVLFSSFHGQYSDSPKAISEKLHELLPAIKIVWVIGEKSKEKILPEYIKTVKPNSIGETFYLVTSKVVVENYLGWLYGQAPLNTKKYYFLSNIKKKKQFNISTWHGTPLKNIEREGIELKIGEVFYTTSDLIISGNTFCTEVLRRKSQNKVNVLEVGTARNDLLFGNDKEKRNQLLERLGLPKDKKICVYAPTFRDNLEAGGIIQIKMLDIRKVREALSEKFGGDWIFVFRVHDSVLQKMEATLNEIADRQYVYSGNITDDMAEYLMVSDVLLTDYSSSIFDYIITKRPCFLFCHDLESYKNVERGLYMDIEKLPFSLAQTEEDLYSDILNFDYVKYNAGVEKLMRDMGFCETGISAQRIVEIICERLK